MAIVLKAPSAEVLSIENNEGISTVTLNRPDAYNALSRQLSLALIDAFEQLQRDDETLVVILTGHGKAFCAGVDLKELAQDPGVLTDNGLGTQSPLVVALNACEKPIIGAVNGAAITGGFELALACDFLYAAESARFADTHARVGILPGWGLSQKLSRLIGVNRAREMSLSGNFISAQQACDWGLVNRVVADDQLLTEVNKVARDIADADGRTVIALKSLMTDGWGMTLGDALELEGERTVAHVKDVNFGAMEQRLQSLRARAAKTNN